MYGVKHLNPRQGITTPRQIVMVAIAVSFPSVKHLNPRQGITTVIAAANETAAAAPECVKHLNPRQGITIQTVRTGVHFRSSARV